jgi:hypothetical protein
MFLRRSEHPEDPDSSKVYCGHVCGCKLKGQIGDKPFKAVKKGNAMLRHARNMDAHPNCSPACRGHTSHARRTLELPEDKYEGMEEGCIILHIPSVSLIIHYS